MHGVSSCMSTRNASSFSLTSTVAALARTAGAVFLAPGASGTPLAANSSTISTSPAHMLPAPKSVLCTSAHCIDQGRCSKLRRLKTSTSLPFPTSLKPKRRVSLPVHSCSAIADLSSTGSPQSRPPSSLSPPRCFYFSPFFPFCSASSVDVAYRKTKPSSLEPLRRSQTAVRATGKVTEKKRRRSRQAAFELISSRAA
jgi:hypothetical protein